MRALLTAIVLLFGGAWPAVQPADSAPSGAASQPADNLDFWLGQAASAPASQPAATEPANPFARQTADNFAHADALPAGVEMSDGKVLTGGLFTTEGKDLELWVEAEKRGGSSRWCACWASRPRWSRRTWRRSGTGEMGADQRVYTSREIPIRRLAWRFNLIDGTSLAGEIKGQPLWIQRDGQRTLLVLHARQQGQPGQSLAEMTYPAHIVISTRFAAAGPGGQRP